MLVNFKCTIKPQILLKSFLRELTLIFLVNLKKKGGWKYLQGDPRHGV